MYSHLKYFFRVGLTVSLSLMFGSALVDAAPSSEAAASASAADRANDFHIILRSDSDAADDVQKYLTFGWNGWSGRVMHWRYNDANRPASIVASASAAVARIQAAMSRWSAVCNIQFVYDGTTTRAASLASSTRDGDNVISWSALSGNTTSITYVGASGFTGSAFTLDEADMVMNSQFNPNLDSTLSHEVGHLLGLKHSDQEGSVMSGPNTAPDPSTAYTSLAVLQADDIAGCRSLYGAPAGSLASPVASATTATLAFADTTVGSLSAGQSVTLSNTGSAPLLINSAVVSASDFSLISTTCNAGSTLLPGASCAATARFAPTTTGARSATLTIAHNATPPSSVVTLSGIGRAATASPATRAMVEYRYAPLDYYFITSRDADKATLDAASGWVRTGASFLVYPTQQTGTRSITRFYFDRVARSAARGSHFYTLLDSELITLANQNPSQSTAPGLAQNEGVDAYAIVPVVAGVGGSCDSGLLPVYRLFRGAVRFPDDPNHRFTTSVSTYNALVAQGWDGEGVNFCVPAS